jgi:serralysin
VSGGVSDAAGAQGNDTLTSAFNGGLEDRFVLSTALNAATDVDRIQGFQPGQDTLVPDRSILSAVGAALSQGEFRSIATGTDFGSVDAGDRIIHLRATGQVFYDTNGSASGGRTQFAQAAPGLIPTFDDFAVID